ncbi:30S ribosomal protein S14 [Bradyrhizobium sp. G127]|jgi:small subunit ribosomal protein S14|uniref:30S ribosomal protein S14 n=1 Tax=Bradyrhizobium sp. G127 TaxID=2904800 RepID=UPI001F417669|nr:30S ribosomal protein S14 [Bradyrhizobium sp. G127]MCF2524107.1 30S ribosomal protein S14 [Bradyrhizobium sp. G127]
MAKKSSVEKNNRRQRMTKNAAAKRAKLKAIIADKKKPMEERFAATIKLAEMPRNSSATRIRNRCEISGRSRSVYRKQKMSRIAIRDYGSKGLIPGLVKSSW